jgi:serine phosphatase RsbU (regulator of sigma subunit)
MAMKVLRWLMRPGSRWNHLSQVPFRRVAILLTAVFVLFSVIGFYGDIMEGGTAPYALVLTIAVYTGVNAAVWVLIVARLPVLFIFLMMAKEAFIPIGPFLHDRVKNTFHPPPVAAETGLHFAGTAILIAVIVSYTLFSIYMGMAGREVFRLQTELDLAQSIQKTLVPPISKTTRCFEIYGISRPSDKVGGDLVDVVELPGGDTVAYLADIAGHGLQAGILMGMLKTAARMALASRNDGDGAGTLSRLMLRINVVLPQVKEAHMFATLTALRLNQDGLAFYGMAASPPLLHWRAGGKGMACLEEEQFPLGLLKVDEFPAGRLAMEPGDLVVVATDGILEVNAKGKAGNGRGANAGGEYGVEALQRLISENVKLPLPELASAILEEVRLYGKQLDDQTLLLVRRVG